MGLYYLVLFKFIGIPDNTDGVARITRMFYKELQL